MELAGRGGTILMPRRRLGVPPSPDIPRRAAHALEYRNPFRIASSLFLSAHKFVRIRRDVDRRTFLHRNEAIPAQFEVTQENCTRDV